MPKDGLEPSWDCSRQILSLVRIPISPLRREFMMIKRFDFYVKKPDGNFVRSTLFASG